MKPYGHTKKDIGFSCPYGCCTGESDKRRGCRDARDRTRRKGARREGNKETTFGCFEVEKD